MKHNILLISAAVALSMAIALPAQAADNAADFVQKASIANKFEIDSSKLALQKSQNADVKQFAQQMIDDHTKAGSQLQSAVSNSKAAVKLADSLDSKHQKLIDTLNGESGSDFDKDYIKDQTRAHKEAVKLFKSYSSNGKDASLKQFASQTLPTLQQHLEHVEQIKSSM